MKKVSLYSLIKDIETIAPKANCPKEHEENEINTHKIEESRSRGSTVVKRRRAKK